MNQMSRNVTLNSGSSSITQLGTQTNLTQNQLGFWLGQRVAKNSTTFNMGQLYRFDFAIDPTHFQAAIRALINHSDALRTQFRETDGLPEQVVSDDVRFDLPLIDLSSENDAEQGLAKWWAERISLPFQLDERCFDFALLKITENTWAWYLCIHHIVIDGASVDLIFRSVAELYELSRDGRLNEAVIPPQFSTYVEKEKRYRNTAACQADEAFWKQRPAIDAAKTTFYGHRRRTDSSNCIRESVKFDAAHTTRLLDGVFQALGPGASADLNLLTGHLALLAAYHYKVGGGDTLTVGIPFHNRASQSEKKTIGLIMEAVPLKIALCADDTFSTLLHKARAEIRAALRHYRFGGTNAAREKSYDLMLNLVPSMTDEFAGGPTQTQWIHSGELNEAVTLQVQHERDGGTLYFDLNQELFPYGLSARVPNHFLTLSNQLLIAPDRSLDSISLMSDSERGFIHSNLRCAGNADVAGETIVSRFEGIAEQFAASVAVAGASSSTTYQKLNEHSNRVARYLLSLGVSGNEYIGICLPRTVDRIAAILAILKAGGAYVPIDEAWPAERRNMVIQDANVELIITNSENAETLNLTGKVRTFNFDECVKNLSSHPGENLVARPNLNDVAYINFTSGSTGRPKGVLVPHAGIVRLSAAPSYSDWNANTVMMHLSSISFDAAAFEMWGTLLNGGKLVLPSQSLPTGEAIRQDIQRHDVNTLFLTTSLFNALVDDDPTVFENIEEFFTAGEAASPSHFAKVAAALPNPRLINCYGPTECSVMVSGYAFTGKERAGLPVPIGKPISDTFVRVLDERYQDVPVGAVGELYVGGPGLALGYVGQSELTQSRFTHLDGRSDDRLYKTGDFVRINEGGDLVFVGRRDNQVKVRGILIELEEIELALNSLPEIDRAVVLMRQAQDATNGLAAYVVPSREGLTVNDLRTSLRKKLPEKMLPRWFVFLDELPLGTTGKVDRKLLPDPEITSPDIAEESLAVPMTEVEESLASIWRELLRLPVVGLDEDFFELGGDSIVAIQFASRAARIGLKLDAEDVFENSTIRALSTSAAVQCDEVPERCSIDGEVSLSPIQRWYFEQHFAEPSHWNMAVMLDSECTIDVSTVDGAVDALVEQHDALRARFTEVDGGWSQYIEPAAISSRVSVVDIKGKTGEELDDTIGAAFLAAQRSLDIEAGEIFRVLLLDAGGLGTSHLLWVVHHLILDGVSWRILLQDFDQAYRQLLRGQVVALSGRTASIRDFSEAREHYAKSSGIVTDLRYWSNADTWSAAPLPVDYTGGKNLEATSKSIWGALSEKETQILTTLVPQGLKTPVNCVLISTLVGVLCEWSGEETILIDLEGHGRERLVNGVDVSRTIGWFTTLFPVLFKNSQSGVMDRLRAVSGEVDKIPSRGIAYGIERYLGADIESTRANLINPPVSFNYLGQFDQLLAEDSAFTLADLFSGEAEIITESISPKNHRTHELDLVVQVEGGRLRVGWFFSTDTHSTTTIQSLLERYLDELREILSVAEQTNASPVGIEKFADSGLDSDQLSSVLAEIGLGAS